jgi:hypothetical protein
VGAVFQQEACAYFIEGVIEYLDVFNRPQTHPFGGWAAFKPGVPLDRAVGMVPVPDFIPRKPAT